MGAYFSQDNVNLPGLAAMFSAHADEERAHGMAFVSYLRMRGDVDNDFLGGGDVLAPILGKTAWLDAEDALRDALAMEKLVTGSIKVN